MTGTSFARPCRLGAAGLLLTLAGGCGALFPTTTTMQPSFYSLDNARAAAPASVAPTVPATAPTLIINPPHAAAGFDSSRIIYVRETHKLEYFSHNEWVDTPARMLAPLIVAAVENSGRFRAVVLTPSAAARPAAPSGEARSSLTCGRRARRSATARNPRLLPVPEGPGESSTGARRP